MINKKSYIVSMNYAVSDEEKHVAEQALLCFNHSTNSLNKASAYLDLMLIPFKDNPEITANELITNRVQLREFRDETLELFQTFMNLAFKCVYLMQTFSSDTQIIKQMKSFISYVDEIEILVNEYAELFSGLEAKEFVKNITETIENIKTKCDDIEELIEQRIKTYIQTNILAKTWVDNIGNKMNLKVQKRKPLNVRLVEKLNEMEQKE